MELLNRRSVGELDRVRMVGEGLNELVSIDEAFNRAEDMGLDLVLVSMDAKPPVVRIQDFRKLAYEKKKARKASKAKQVSGLKEMQFKVNISDHDLAIKANKIEKFLEKGVKVKIIVRLKGRERENPERAKMVVHRVEEAVGCVVNLLPAAGAGVIAILEPGTPKTAQNPK